MTVTATTARNVSTAAAAATVFPYSFKIVTATDLLVTVNGVAKVLNVDYTLTGVGADIGGNVTLTTPLVGGEIVLRKRAMAYARPVDYQVLGDLRSSTMNNDIDATVLMSQQLADSIGLALKLPADSSASAQLPTLVPLAPLVVGAAGLTIEMGSTTQTGDMLLRGNLASTVAGKGSALVAWLQTGVGAVVRTLLAKLLESPISPEDFGAVGDGVTDDYAAINAAMQAAKTAPRREVHFTKAVYAHATMLDVPQGVQLLGRGSTFSAYLSYAASIGTELKYTGSIGGGSIAVRFMSHNYGGGGMQRMLVNSNNRADIGIQVNGSQGLIFDRVNSFSCVATADLMLTATASPLTITANCKFSNMYLGTNTNGKASLYLTGVSGADATVCVFDNLRIDHGGTRHAIVLGDCDNNTFNDVLINRAGGGTGYGVLIDPTEQPNFPISNIFHHLGCGVGGWYQPATTAVSPGIVYDYMLDNGSPYPVLNGTPLQYSTGFGFITSEIPRFVGAAGQPGFLSSWVNFGAPRGNISFWKDRLGFVHLAGTAKTGTLASTMFILPTGYLPLASEYFPVSSNGAYGECYVDSTGHVVPQVGSNTSFSVAGITFRADYAQS
jgi:hypothetical protein